MSKLFVFTLALIAVTISQALSAPPALRGADQSQTCLRPAQDAPAAQAAALMCMSRFDFRNASFRGANLSGADLSGADLDGADFTAADLSMTSLNNTDLSRVKGLSQFQLDQACGNLATKVRRGLKVHSCTEEFFSAG